MKVIKKPCNECPFRKDSIPGWLADYTPEQLHQVVMSENPFPCHRTHDHDLYFEETKDYPLCAGALRYMKQGGKIPRDPDLAKEVAKITTDDCSNILTIAEFFKHHKK